MGEAESVISVESLCKKYVLRHEAEKQETSLREALSGGVRSVARRLLGKATSASAPVVTREEFWALQDISFEVKRGSVVGVIGRNGAGKSTLLKILSRITEPTSGRVEITGRVSSLLEVGTGFHPELTGRENIFLNGAILGMSRQEIRRKFDEIVAFSEIEKFLDTPVKRYSSGMYVRLAFAVAAHLEPEILIIDEVLAVGDAPFQKKCLGRMRDVAGEGRTVLFVSHNMAAVQALCTEAIWIHSGRLEKKGHIDEVSQTYLQRFMDLSTKPIKTREDRRGSGEARFTNVTFESPKGCPVSFVLSGAPCVFGFEYSGSRPLRAPVLKMTIYNRISQAVTHLNTTFHHEKIEELPASGLIFCHVDRLPLAPGTYRVNAALADSSGLLDHLDSVMTFVVDVGNYYRTDHPPTFHGDVCLVDHSWTMHGSVESASSQSAASINESGAL